MNRSVTVGASPAQVFLQGKYSVRNLGSCVAYLDDTTDPTSAAYPLGPGDQVAWNGACYAVCPQGNSTTLIVSDTALSFSPSNVSVSVSESQAQASQFIGGQVQVDAASGDSPYYEIVQPVPGKQVVVNSVFIMPVSGTPAGDIIVADILAGLYTDKGAIAATRNGNPGGQSFPGGLVLPVSGVPAPHFSPPQIGLAIRCLDATASTFYYSCSYSVV